MSCFIGSTNITDVTDCIGSTNFTSSLKPFPLAISPCPNDTFIFYAWIHSMIESGVSISPVFADVQHLNHSVLKKENPISKVSINCLGKILEDYILLPTGAALGSNNGPKIIAKESFCYEDLGNKIIAVPGKDTTAYLLLQLLMPNPKKVIFCTYEQVVPMLASGEVDAGLIIHETRFTFEKMGFKQIVDLGEFWERKYNLLLPLGGIVAKRELGEEVLEEITNAIQASLNWAWEIQGKDKAFLDYVLQHSQEKEPKVVQQHIDLYVNQESLALSDCGVKSIEKLLSLARGKGLLPDCKKELIFHR